MQNKIPWIRIVLIYFASISLIGYPGFFLLWVASSYSELYGFLTLCSYLVLGIGLPTFAAIAIRKDRLQFLNIRVLVGILFIPLIYHIFFKLLHEQYHTFKIIFYCWFFLVLFLILLSNKLHKIWYFVIIGIAAPIILQLLLGLGFLPHYYNISKAMLILRTIVFSLLMSLSFWLIAVWSPYKLFEKSLKRDE